MRAATERNLPPVMPQGNLVEVLGREVRQGSPGELMVESSPSRQRRRPCKTSKEMSDEALDAAALTYLLTWVLGPGPGRPPGRINVPRMDHVRSNRGRTRRSDPMFRRRSGDEERDKCLSADYRRRPDHLCTPSRPESPRHAPEPAPPSYGRYGALRGAYDIEVTDGDAMDDFEISTPRGSVSCSCRQRQEEEYMEAVRRGVLAGAYVQEPRRSCLDIPAGDGRCSCGSPHWTPLGTPVDLATGVHGLQGRRRRRGGKT